MRKHRSSLLSTTMHPFGGTPICPRCSKAVYAAEQVRTPVNLFVKCPYSLAIDNGTRSKGVRVATRLMGIYSSDMSLDSSITRYVTCNKAIHMLTDICCSPA